MDRQTKLLIVLALAYNVLLGYSIKLTSQPYIVMFFLSLDFLLITYYVLFLVKENYGLAGIGKRHGEEINKAKAELKEQGYIPK